MYDVLRKRCSLILETSPVSESQWRSQWQRGQWCSAVHAARTTQGRIFDLLIAHHIDPNTAYRDRAAEELRQLIHWSTWVDPCHTELPADQCTAEAALGAVVGLDWLWEDLSEADRFRVLQAVRHKAIQPYKQAVTHNASWYEAYHHQNAVVNSGCGLAALALSDDEPQAREAFTLARNGLRHFFDALGREGGWDEGVGYWGYAMRHLLLLGEACARLIDDQRVFHSRGMDVTGLFPVYFTPNGQPASFGDAPSAPLLGSLYLLVKHFGIKEVTWWLDTYAFQRDVATTGWASAGLALLFRPIDAEVTTGQELKPIKVFNEVGWAAMADKWPPRFYAAAKAGDLSAHHSQRDMNSIQVQVDGEMLLTDLGPAPYSREYLGEERSDFYEVQARAHNCVIVGERDYRIDSQGSIIEAQTDRDYRWLACDAGTAAGEAVHFIRHLLMVVNPASSAGRMLLVLDEISNPVPEKIEMFWHTHGQLEFDPATMSGMIVGARTALNLAMVSSVKCTAAVEAREVASRRVDRMIHLTAPATSKAVVLSVFSREKLPGKIDLKLNHQGEVRIRIGSISLHFKPHRRHLELESICGT